MREDDKKGRKKKKMKMMLLLLLLLQSALNPSLQLGSFVRQMRAVAFSFYLLENNLNSMTMCM
jgi:hypothetical protein